MTLGERARCPQSCEERFIFDKEIEARNFAIVPLDFQVGVSGRSGQPGGAGSGRAHLVGTRGGVSKFKVGREAFVHQVSTLACLFRLAHAPEVATVKYRFLSPDSWARKGLGLT